MVNLLLSVWFKAVMRKVETVGVDQQRTKRGRKQEALWEQLFVPVNHGGFWC